MKLSIEVLRSLLESTQGPEGFAMEAIEHCEEVSGKMHGIRREYSKAQEAWEQDSRIFDRRIAEAQSECRHLVKKRFSDPSGGTDYFTECQICGKHL